MLGVGAVASECRRLVGHGALNLNCISMCKGPAAFAGVEHCLENPNGGRMELDPKEELKLSLAKHGISALAYAAHMAAKSASLRRMLFNSIRLNRIETERFRSTEECGFLAYAFLNRHESKSQILQDLWVSYELGEKRGGFFVEFGATNGAANSNTWLLEKKYGWRGILAEPNPVWHSMLKANRETAIDHRCVSSSTGKMVTFLTTDGSDPELSSMAEFASGDHFAEVRAKGTEIKVETVSLNELLIEHSAPVEIDYLSVDTEGSEYDILSHFDFSRHVIDLISVEQNRHTEGKIENLLTRHGYDRVFREFSQWDGWYARPERRRHGSRVEMDDISNLARARSGRPSQTRDKHVQQERAGL